MYLFCFEPQGDAGSFYTSRFCLAKLNHLCFVLEILNWLVSLIGERPSFVSIIFETHFLVHWGEPLPWASLTSLFSDSKENRNSHRTLIWRKSSDQSFFVFITQVLARRLRFQLERAPGESSLIDRTGRTLKMEPLSTVGDLERYLLKMVRMCKWWLKVCN